MTVTRAVPAPGLAWDAELRAYVIVVILEPDQARDLGDLYGPRDGAYRELHDLADRADELQKEYGGQEDDPVVTVTRVLAEDEPPADPEPKHPYGRDCSAKCRADAEQDQARYPRTDERREP